MNLAEHFRIIWSGRWRVLLAGRAGDRALALAWRSTRPSVYRASTLVSAESGRAIAGVSASEQDTVFLARNYAEVAHTLPVVTEATQRPGLAISPTQARDLITLSVAADVEFVTIAAGVRRPNVHVRLGFDPAPGLGDLLNGAPLEKVLTTSPALGQLQS